MQKFIRESWLVIVMGIVFGGMLAAAQTTLYPLYDQNRKQFRNEAIREVVPNVGEIKPVAEDEMIDGQKYSIFRCVDQGGALAGWAIQAVGPGFIDKITLIVGLDPAAETITGIKVIEHLETPGLGNKIETKPGYKFPTQFSGKSTSQTLEVVKRPPQTDTEIEAITGATWSSRYVADIINRVNKKVIPTLDQYR